MLDAQAQRYLDELAALDEPGVEELDPVAARERMYRLRLSMGTPAAPPCHVSDRTVPGPDGPISIRVYSPGAGAPLPVVVYYHGGGWVLGDLDMVDGLARSISCLAHCIVVSVAYRLAPEHPFPASFEDAYAATQWVARNAASVGGDAACVAVAGDSAGGTLAAAVCLAARDRGGPALAAQLLLYPAVEPNCDRPSFTAFGAGYALTSAAMRWFWSHYLGTSANAGNPYAAPLRATHLRDLPPATIVIAGYDPLCDEGIAYADRLRNDGNSVQVLRYDGMLHGFMLGAYDCATQAIADCCAALQAAFAADVPADVRASGPG